MHPDRQSKTKKPSSKPILPTTFDIDLSVCAGCRSVSKSVPFIAIKMDQEFELATRTVRTAETPRPTGRPNTHFQNCIHRTPPPSTPGARDELARHGAAAASAALKPAAEPTAPAA